VLAQTSWKHFQKVHLVPPATKQAKAKERMLAGKANPTPNSAEGETADGCCSYGRYAKFGGAR